MQSTLGRDLPRPRRVPLQGHHGGIVNTQAKLRARLKTLCGCLTACSLTVTAIVISSNKQSRGAVPNAHRGPETALSALRTSLLYASQQPHELRGIAASTSQTRMLRERRGNNGFAQSHATYRREALDEDTGSRAPESVPQPPFVLFHVPRARGP